MALVTIPNAPEGVNDPSALWRLSVTVDQRDLRFKVRVSPSLALRSGCAQRWFRFPLLASR